MRAACKCNKGQKPPVKSWSYASFNLTPSLHRHQRPLRGGTRAANTSDQKDKIPKKYAQKSQSRTTQRCVKKTPYPMPNLSRRSSSTGGGRLNSPAASQSQSMYALRERLRRNENMTRGLFFSPASRVDGPWDLALCSRADVRASRSLGRGIPPLLFPPKEAFKSVSEALSPPTAVADFFRWLACVRRRGFSFLTACELRLRTGRAGDILKIRHKQAGPYAASHPAHGSFAGQGAIVASRHGVSNNGGNGRRQRRR